MSQDEFDEFLDEIDDADILSLDSQAVRQHEQNSEADRPQGGELTGFSQRQDKEVSTRILPSQFQTQYSINGTTDLDSRELSEIEQLKKEVLLAKGETAILRASLRRVQQQHVNEINQLKKAHNEYRQNREAQLLMLEEDNKALKVQQQFISQDERSSFKRKRPKTVEEDADPFAVSENHETALAQTAGHTGENRQKRKAESKVFFLPDENGQYLDSILNNVITGLHLKTLDYLSMIDFRQLIRNARERTFSQLVGSNMNIRNQEYVPFRYSSEGFSITENDHSITAAILDFLALNRKVFKLDQLLRSFITALCGLIKKLYILKIIIPCPFLIALIYQSLKFRPNAVNNETLQVVVDMITDICTQDHFALRKFTQRNMKVNHNMLLFDGTDNWDTELQPEAAVFATGNMIFSNGKKTSSIGVLAHLYKDSSVPNQFEIFNNMTAIYVIDLLDTASRISNRSRQLLSVIWNSVSAALIHSLLTADIPRIILQSLISALLHSISIDGIGPRGSADVMQKTLSLLSKKLTEAKPTSTEKFNLHGLSRMNTNWTDAKFVFCYFDPDFRSNEFSMDTQKNHSHLYSTMDSLITKSLVTTLFQKYLLECDNEKVIDILDEVVFCLSGELCSRRKDMYMACDPISMISLSDIKAQRDVVITGLLEVIYLMFKMKDNQKIADTLARSNAANLLISSLTLEYNDNIESNGSYVGSIAQEVLELLLTMEETDELYKLCNPTNPL